MAGVGALRRLDATGRVVVCDPRADFEHLLRIGPTVCELERPMPILKGSNSLTAIAVSRLADEAQRLELRAVFGDLGRDHLRRTAPEQHVGDVARQAWHMVGRHAPSDQLGRTHSQPVNVAIDFRQRQPDPAGQDVCPAEQFRHRLSAAEPMRLDGELVRRRRAPIPGEDRQIGGGERFGEPLRNWV